MHTVCGAPTKVEEGAGECGRGICWGDQERAPRFQGKVKGLRWKAKIACGEESKNGTKHWVAGSVRKKKSEGASPKKKNCKAFFHLREHHPRSSKGSPRSSEGVARAKLNHQMKILFWTSPMLALFWPVLAPPLVCSIPPSHPRAFSFRDLHPSIMCRNMPFSSLENTQHFIIMPKSKKRKPHTQVSVQCLHCKQIFKKASLWEDGRVHSQGLSVHLGHKSKITCHECCN